MKKSIEIKAMTQENAVERALNILDAKSYQITNIDVKQKPKNSFLGLFNKEGIFEVFVDKEISEETVKKNVIKEKTILKENVKQETVKKEVETKTKEIKKEKKVETKKAKTATKDVEVKIEKKLEINENEDIAKIIEEKAKILIENIGLDLTMNIEKIKEKTYLVKLYGPDNGIIIGKKGKTLNSFEYLLNLMVKGYRIEVDVEGFKEKREKTLQELAKKMAEKAIKTNKLIKLNPMPPKERRIIHEVLNTYKELETYSEGRDPKRYIVIKKKR